MIPLDHPDPEREAALTALGGQAHRCVALSSLWTRHGEDLDVLLLASRGPADTIRPRQDADPLRHHVHGRRHGGHFGWHAYAPLAGGSPEPQPTAGLEDLLRLPAGLPHRLVTQVLSTWTDRWSDDGDDIAPVLPQLQAALYGRLAPVLRAWLAEPDLRVELHHTPPGESPRLTRRDAAMHVALPFSWLLDVWAPGVTVILDGFTIAADEVATDEWELITVDRDLRQRVVRISAAPLAQAGLVPPPALDGM